MYSVREKERKKKPNKTLLGNSPFGGFYHSECRTAIVNAANLEHLNPPLSRGVWGAMGAMGAMGPHRGPNSIFPIVSAR